MGILNISHKTTKKYTVHIGEYMKKDNKFKQHLKIH